MTPYTGFWLHSYCSLLIFLRAIVHYECKSTAYLRSHYWGCIFFMSEDYGGPFISICHGYLLAPLLAVIVGETVCFFRRHGKVFVFRAAFKVIISSMLLLPDLCSVLYCQSVWRLLFGSSLHAFFHGVPVVIGRLYASHRWAVRSRATGCQGSSIFLGPASWPKNIYVVLPKFSFPIPSKLLSRSQQLPIYGRYSSLN